MSEKYPDILDLDTEPAERARIAEGTKILDVYQGDHEPHLKNIEYDLVKVNVFRKIINKKIELLYQTEPTRTVGAGSGLETSYRENMSKELTGIMREIVLTIELFGSVYVDWVNQEMFTPMQVFEKDKRQMVLKSSSVMRKKFQWVYEDTRVYEFVDKRMERELSPSVLDEYKKEGKDYKKIVELADLQLELTRVATFLKVGTVLQAVDQIFTDDVELTRINMSPEVVNYKAKDSKVDIVHFMADLVNIRENYKTLKKDLYEMGGVPEVAVVGDVQSRSAKELVAKWYPLVETYRTMAREYEKIEGAVVSDLFKKHLNIIFDKKNYTVEFDRNFLPAAKREVEQAQFELDNNVITIVKLLKEENPVLTDAEIDALLVKNVEVNKKYKPVTQKDGQGERSDSEGARGAGSVF